MMMNLREKVKNQKGFTLIELMIVVVIIGILAAIALPRFNDSARSSRGSRIAADLRTIDGGIQQAIANGNDAPDQAAVAAFLASGTWPTPPAGTWTSPGFPQSQAAPGTYEISTDLRATASDHTVEQIEGQPAAANP
jgi:general secretion pathway protein G